MEPKYQQSANNVGDGRAPLDECWRILSDELMGAVRAMMDRVDDALFSLADKAENNTIQARYFDAMREVRIQRPLLEQDFQRRLREQCETDSDVAASEGDGFGGSLELSLVEQDDQERDLAVSSMARKVREGAEAELHALDQRVGKLVGRWDLQGEDNPLRPEVLCREFGASCELIGSGIEIQLLVLKLFDQHVAVHIPALYTQLNRYLIDHGILPALPAAPAATIRQTSRPNLGIAAPPADMDIEAGPAGLEGNNEETAFALMRQLLGLGGMGLEGPPTSARGWSGGGNGGSAPPSSGGATSPVIMGLTELQRNDTQADAPGIDPGVVVAGTTNVLRALRETPMARDAGPVEQMTIDIVAMMFDYILDDRNLPDRMKAIVGRLQIPVLKVAMLDREFFRRRAHPARRLVDTLAEAALGWNECHPEDEGLHEEAERIVDGIRRDFEDDIGLFSRYLDELEQFLSRESTQAAEETDESAQVIQGREQLQAAKEMAAAEVQARVEAHELPPAIERLLVEHWKELLVLHYFHEGALSEVWTEALETMDALVWSVTPKTNPEERRQLVARLPTLLPKLIRGLSLAGTTKDQRNEILGDLSALHAAAVRPPGTAESSGTPPAESGDSEAEVETETETETETEEAAREPGAAGILQQAVLHANRHVYDVAETRPQCKGMGTTAVATLFHDNHVIVAHVGDSRLYRLRGDCFEQVTKDHSLAQELIDKGFFSAEEARDFGRKNVVTRAMGVDPTVRPGLNSHPVEVGDVYLLCSDGLSDLVTDARISEVLEARRDDLDQAAAELVAQANDNGGKDNISVILVRVEQAFPASDEGLCELEGALTVGALTDVGIKRAHNEDTIETDAALGLMLLADGMGGANAGEVASRLAVEVIAQHVRERGETLVAGGGLEADDLAADDSNAADPVAVEVEADAEIEEIVLSGSGVVEAPAPEDEFMAMTRQLSIGDWVEFQRGDGDTVRARLSWVSAATGTYLFTNRRGIKVIDATPYGLAIEFRRGSATIMEQVPLLERAVSSLTERLKSKSAV